jgi:glycosyltransferase involved in cell wall biosynthesis
MAKPAQLVSSLSAFFPCFNEEANLRQMVDDFEAVLPQVAKVYELIIIDDGSTDQTPVIAQELVSRNPHLRLIRHDHNLGYGSSLRSGFAAARYEWTFFTDGDRQFDVQELKSFLPFTQNYHVIIGYRLHRAEGNVRAINARLFKLYIDILFRVHVKDIDCAFKLIKTELLQSISFTSTGAMINSELLYMLKKRREPFKQLPVTHHKRIWGKPTGNNFKVVIKAAFEAIKLYLRLKFNLYL